MDQDDDLKQLIDLEPDCDSSDNPSARADKIIRQNQRRQSQATLIEFGLVKIWTIFLEFLAQLHTSSQYNKKMIKHEPGVKHEL